LESEIGKVDRKTYQSSRKTSSIKFIKDKASSSQSNLYRLLSQQTDRKLSIEITNLISLVKTPSRQSLKLCTVYVTPQQRIKKLNLCMNCFHSDQPAINSIQKGSQHSRLLFKLNQGFQNCELKQDSGTKTLFSINEQGRSLTKSTANAIMDLGNSLTLIGKVLAKALKIQVQFETI
jgi:hypothetical protein